MQERHNIRVAARNEIEDALQTAAAHWRGGVSALPFSRLGWIAALLSVLVCATGAGARQFVIAQNRTPPKPGGVPPGVRVLQDLEYARGLRLDLYLPERASGPVPVVVAIHGGGWATGRKEGAQGIRLSGHGYAVAAIGYRLSGVAIFPAQIQDCKAAVRWLRANAGKYHLDADRFGAMGHSAGGHLASLLGTSGGVEDFDQGEHLDCSSRVQAVCALSGPTDFLQMDAHAPLGAPLKHDSPGSPESRLIGAPIQENKDKVARANPITYVDKDDPPFLLIHGALDPVVPAHQAELLHRALQNAGVEVTMRLIEGAGHGIGGRESAESIECFFDKHLKKRTGL
jgi:acetyl esterase/lipase